MEVVSKEVSARVSTMSVEDAEKGAFGPDVHVFFGWRLHNIQNDADTVFVVVTDDSLVGVCSVPHYTSVFTDRTLGWLPCWQVQAQRVWRCTVAQQQLLHVNFFWLLRSRSALRSILVVLDSWVLWLLIITGGVWPVTLFTPVCCCVYNC